MCKNEKHGAHLFKTGSFNVSQHNYWLEFTRHFQRIPPADGNPKSPWILFAMSGNPGFKCVKVSPLTPIEPPGPHSCKKSVQVFRTLQNPRKAQRLCYKGGSSFPLHIISLLCTNSLKLLVQKLQKSRGGGGNKMKLEQQNH